MHGLGLYGRGADFGPCEFCNLGTSVEMIEGMGILSNAVWIDESSRESD